MQLLHKPYFEYNLLDSLIIFGLLTIAVLAYHGIKLGVLILKLHIKNRRDK